MTIDKSSKSERVGAFPRKTGIDKIGHFTIFMAIVAQIGAFIFQSRYDSCINYRARMYTMAHHLGEVNHNADRAGLPRAQSSIADIMEVLGSKDLDPKSHHSLQHIDSTVRERLWVRLHQILQKLSKHCENLNVKKSDLAILMQHFHEMSKKTEFGFIPNKAGLKQASDDVREDLLRSPTQIASDLNREIIELWHVVDALAEEMVYGTLSLLADEYSKTLEGQKQREISLNAQDFEDKALIWAIIWAHKRNTEEVPMIKKYRMHSFILQILAISLFMCSSIFFFLAFRYERARRLSRR